MSVFDAYARYYDLLYRDKDYEAETDYVEKLIKQGNPDAKSILELGCGTGLHAVGLARRGYSVLGVDLSRRMLDSAWQRIEKEPPAVREAVSFEYGDARSYRSPNKFDCILALFHVASYQTTNIDVSGFFNTAAVHLNPGGIFIFDFWYGPAVIFDGPQVRVKRFEDKNTKITRICEPQWVVNENRIDVKYEIQICDSTTKAVETVHETHPMRYFFLPEVSDLIEANGFKRWHAEEWMSGREPGLDTWGICMSAHL